MARSRTSVRLAGAVCTALATGLLAGCGGGSTADAEAEAEAQAQARETPEVVSHVDAMPSEVPTPAETSGPLTKEQLPDGTELGASWEPYANPGGGESGVIGNGSSAQRREVGELMEGLAPIGCDAGVDIALPRPRYALEGTYRGSGDAPGVSLVLQFDGAGKATKFLTALGRQVDACPDSGKPSDPFELKLTFTRLAMPEGRLAALRQSYGADADPSPYLLVAVWESDRVALAYLAGAKPAERTRVAEGLAKAAAR